jgi:coenzyme F420-reducing hydrogenase delta subunit/NAD-dependent dihydropyrimidine dehydrogenase PreA subunit
MGDEAVGRKRGGGVFMRNSCGLHTDAGGTPIIVSFMPLADHPGRRLLAAADALANRLYGSSRNPLYQSGTIAVALLLVLLATGLWLVLFYRVGAPWASVRGITSDPWIGRWVRGLHRYASDAALVATLVHATRIVVQRRTWGPRVLAWVTGLVLLALLLACGVTGFVLVWDEFGRALAVEGARILDALPILSEPVSRTFVGERPIPGTFFFLTLFLHIAVPLGMGAALWLHVSRLARPLLLPPKPLAWGIVGLLTLAALAAPLPMEPEGTAFALPGRVTLDWFYGGWLPLTGQLAPGSVWLVGLVATALLLCVPRWTRPREGTRPPSVVDEAICVGCWQCSWDCPYDAITMVPRTDGRAEVVARVDPGRCVSCGICAGSCAPMGVGPPGRNGRDQVERVRAYLTDPTRRPGEIVAVPCEYGAGVLASLLRAEGATVYPVDCAGNLHTSVVELLVRGGAAGVLVLPCPARDCRNREGARWLAQRIDGGREAELQARVDRRRVAVVAAAADEAGAVIAAVRRFRASLEQLRGSAPGAAAELDLTCERPPLPAPKARR